MKILGKSIHQEGLNRRLLMALLLQRISNIIVIEESKDLLELSIDNLIGSLVTYEMGIGKLKVGAQRTIKKIVALKSIKPKVIQEESKDWEQDEEIDILSRKIKRILVKSKRINISKKSQDSLHNIHDKSKKESLYFVCTKPGHLKIDCPNLKDSERRKQW